MSTQEQHVAATPVELSSRPLYTRNHTAPVAQLDRVTASEAVGCAFEPRRAHFFQNPKSQAPNPKQLPNTKFQISSLRRFWDLILEISLELGS
jgi:hypothetical protein